MLEAFFWGIIAASSLLAGAVLAERLSISDRVLGLVMGFAAGVLISAVAYDLILDASELHAPRGIAAGLFVGAIVFFVGDQLISRRAVAGGRTEGRAAVGPLAIVLGAILDGIPESVVLGLTLLESSISATLLVAIFISNLPEALVATTGLIRSGWRRSEALLLWCAVVLVAGLASALGYGFLKDAPDETIAFVQAFAAGAILTMLADSMMPEAFDKAGSLAGLVTTLGFATAFAITALE